MENKQISIYECAEALELAEYSVDSFIQESLVGRIKIVRN